MMPLQKGMSTDFRPNYYRQTMNFGVIMAFVPGLQTDLVTVTAMGLEAAGQRYLRREWFIMVAAVQRLELFTYFIRRPFAILK